MQQACHTRAITDCEDLSPILRAEASAECLKTRRFSGLPERRTKLTMSAMAARDGRTGTSAHQGSAGATAYRTFVGHRAAPSRCAPAGSAEAPDQRALRAGRGGAFDQRSL